MYKPDIFSLLHDKKPPFLLVILTLFMSMNPMMTLAANDSNQALAPATNVRQQYLSIDSQTPTQSQSTLGNSNRTISCGTNQQIVGIIEQNTGGNASFGNMPFSRQGQFTGNYLYVPRCAYPSATTGQCTRDWVKEYVQIDTLRLRCANNIYLWEDQNNPHQNPDSKAGIIGSYERSGP